VCAELESAEASGDGDDEDSENGEQAIAGVPRHGRGGRDGSGRRVRDGYGEGVGKGEEGVEDKGGEGGTGTTEADCNADIQRNGFLQCSMLVFRSGGLSLRQRIMIV